MYNKTAIIGLGYVGLPLAVEIGKKYSTIGYDINEQRLDELKTGLDRTNEVSLNELEQANDLTFTSNLDDLYECDLFIITVPTPVDKSNKPDLSIVESASKAVGSIMKEGATVVYESTVFPGCTEEICVPILEQESGLKYNEGFYCGYSPERINPGDKIRRLTTIIKVVSGSNDKTANKLNDFYKSFVLAGTHLASSIKVAEASKVIENAQRDINIAFVNELAIIFNELDIDSEEVLNAARTKWNFLPFKPGLVGGHCIGVDPFYLTYKAKQIGYNPQVILSGRRINDNMGSYVAQQVVKEVLQKDILLNESRFLVLGIAFKENCPDIRNSRVIDIINELSNFNIDYDVYDPCVDSKEVLDEYDIELIPDVNQQYDAVILAVAHNNFNQLDIDAIRKETSVVYDVKSFFPREKVDIRL